MARVNKCPRRAFRWKSCVFPDGIRYILFDLWHLVQTYVVRGGAAAGNNSIVMP